MTPNVHSKVVKNGQFQNSAPTIARTNAIPAAGGAKISIPPTAAPIALKYLFCDFFAMPTPMWS